MSLLLPLTIVCSLVAAQPYFQQPPSSQDNLLGKRCFAYSTLNALKECGIYDFNDHAGTADDWIRAHFANDDGGSPARVVQQLTQEGIQGVQLKMYGPNPPPPTQNIITKTRKIGTANRIGAAIAISKISSGSNHWCYAKKDQPQAEGKIVAFDQQTLQTRNFEWKCINQNTVNRAQAKLDEFIAMKALVPSQKKADRDALAAYKTRVGWTQNRMNWSTPPVVPAKKYAYADEHGWKMTGVSFLGPTVDGSNPAHREYGNYQDAMFGDYQYEPQYGSVTDTVPNNIGYGGLLAMELTMAVMLCAFSVCCIAAVCFGIGMLAGNWMKTRDRMDAKVQYDEVQQV